MSSNFLLHRIQTFSFYKQLLLSFFINHICFSISIPTHPHPHHPIPSHQTPSPTHPPPRKTPSNPSTAQPSLHHQIQDPLPPQKKKPTLFVKSPHIYKLSYVCMYSTVAPPKTVPPYSSVPEKTRIIPSTPGGGKKEIYAL